MPKDNINNDRLLTRTEVAEQLRISLRTFQTWCGSGQFPAPDLRRGKVLRWKRSTVRRWIDNQSPNRAA